MSKKKELAALRSQTEALTVQTEYLSKKNNDRLAEIRDDIPVVYLRRIEEANAKSAEASEKEKEVMERFSLEVSSFNAASKEFHAAIDQILGGCSK
ncbi:MAG: hypothetical protein ACI32C_02325 [Candidatus Enteromonas sp.]